MCLRLFIHFYSSFFQYVIKIPTSDFDKQGNVALFKMRASPFIKNYLLTKRDYNTWKKKYDICIQK